MLSCRCEPRSSGGIDGQQGIQAGLQPPTLAQDESVLHTPTLPRGVGWEDAAVTVKVPGRKVASLADVAVMSTCFNGLQTHRGSQHLAEARLGTMCVVGFVRGTESFS